MKRVSIVGGGEGFLSKSFRLQLASMSGLTETDVWQGWGGGSSHKRKAWVKE